MPYEAKLPEAERTFVQLDDTWDVQKFLAAPVGAYLAWVFAYWLLMFVLVRRRIKERNYDTLYNYYNR